MQNNNLKKKQKKGWLIEKEIKTKDILSNEDFHPSKFQDKNNPAIKHAHGV